VYAARFDVPSLPQCNFPDTEVSTNIFLGSTCADAFNVDINIRAGECFVNCLNVAFGRDSNSNGVLDFDEIDTVYGWRHGRYVVENVRTWERFESCSSGCANSGSIAINIKNSSDVVPFSFSAKRGGSTAFGSIADKPPPWLFRPEWDMMRVVRRGESVSDDWVSCNIRRHSFLLIVR